MSSRGKLAVNASKLLIGVGVGVFMLPFIFVDAEEPQLFNKTKCKDEWEEFMSFKEAGQLEPMRKARRSYYNCHYKALYRVI